MRPRTDNPSVAAILGIDVGTKTLGLAVSDETETIAFTLRTVQRRSLERDLVELRRELDERASREVVVGWPLNLDGTPGALQTEVAAVAAALEQLGYTLHRWDERMTTVAAERALLEADLSRRKRKQVIDKVAAALMLQGFLDHRKLGQQVDRPAEEP
jgi:putative Holliday junction resolvase